MRPVADCVWTELNKVLSPRLELRALYNASLLTDSGSFDIRIRELMLFVKRRCKDRSVGHVAKSNLLPYGLNLLTTHANFPLTSGLAQQIDKSSIMKHVASTRVVARMLRATCQQPSQIEGSCVSTETLLTECFDFYAKRFDGANEAISVRHGRWCLLGAAASLHKDARVVTVRYAFMCLDTSAQVNSILASGQHAGALT